MGLGFVVDFEVVEVEDGWCGGVGDEADVLDYVGRRGVWEGGIYP